MTRSSLAAAAIVLSAIPSLAQDEGGLPRNPEPVLRIEPGGPLNFVRGLAFSPDGRTLYAAGWDKVVHVWTRTDEDRFVHRPERTLRPPIGPGVLGAIDAMALSDDGRWLAVGGRGMARDVADVREGGLVWPAAARSQAARLDEGTIYVFDTRNGTARGLRGHAGPILALAFAPAGDGEDLPALVSVAEERFEGRLSGRVIAWNLGEGTIISDLNKVPVPDARPAAQWPWRPLPERGGWTPTVAAWRTGPQPADLRVALAWGDNEPPAQPTQGWLRVWDVASGSVGAYRTPPGMLVAALCGDQPPRLITGAFDEIRVWDPPVEGGRFLDSRASRSVDKVPADALPLAAAVYATEAGAGPDRAACVVLTRDGMQRFAYQLVDFGVARPEAAASRELWTLPAEKVPAVAVSRGGELLAVAGDETDEILIFDLPEFLRNGGEPRQRLRGGHIAVERVAFVRRADDETAPAALALTIEGRPQVLDPENGALVAFDAEWRRWAPETESWTTRDPDRNGRARLAAMGVRLKADEEPTAYVVCPPCEHYATPLIVAALHRRGEPLLRVYDGRDGLHVRDFTGHAGPIHSLAVSGNGEFLASASEDRTVQVWSLKDIDRTRGRIGALPGVVIAASGDQLVVTESGRSAPRVGDVVTGATAGGKQITPITPWDVYELAARQTPGSNLTLHVRRGAAESDVSLPVGQGVDERKPLLSLFLAQGEKGTLRWIGWQPIGTYETSGPDAEALLGWHFNTGEPGRPVRFAGADQYRDQNYRKGLLRELLGGPPPPPPDPPRMSLLLIDDPDDPNLLPQRQGEFLARQGDLGAVVELDDFPQALIRSVEWRLGDGEPVQFSSSSGSEPGATFSQWEANLSQVAWSRGVHDLHVRVTTNEEPARHFDLRQAIRFQPHAPETAFEQPAEPVAQTDKETLTVRAAVEPGAAGETVVAVLRHNGKEVRRWREALHEPLTVEHEIALTEGPNEIELEARHADAFAGSEDLERSSSVRRVVFVPNPGPPVFLWLQATDPDTGRAFPLDAGQTIVADVPRIRIEGTIDAPDLLRTAEWHAADDPDTAAAPLEGFQPGAAKRFDVAQTLTLAPGRQTFRFRAKTRGSELVQNDLVVDYRPQLPQLTMPTLEIPDAESPRRYPFGRVPDLVEGREPRELRAVARLEWPADPRPAEVAVLVNGEIVGEPVAITADATRVELPLTMTADRGQVRLRVTSEWHPTGELTESALIVYRRPPKVLDVRAAQRPGRTTLDFSAVVATTKALPISGVSVVLNGQPLRPDALSVRQREAEPAIWDVALLEPAPLQVGENRLVVRAENADGQSEPHTVSLMAKRPEPTLKVRFDNIPAAGGAKTSEAEFPVEIRIHVDAERDLAFAYLEVAGREPVSLLERLPEANSLGDHVLTLPVRLDAGPNELRLHASDGEDRATAVGVVNLVPRPVTLVIDRITAPNAPNVALSPIASTEGITFDQAAPDGHVLLSGHVEWPDGKEDPRSAEDRIVRVLTNGFLQIARLKEDSTFEAAIVLNHEENCVEVELPGVAVEDTSRSLSERLRIDCIQPEEDQVLHLLVMGVEMDHDDDNVADGAALTHRALEMLRSEPWTRMAQGDDGVCVVWGPSSRFPDEMTIAHDPLVGNAARSGNVRAQLTRIGSLLRKQAKPGSPGHVFAFYYHGREVVTPDGDFRLADRANWSSPERDDSALTGRELAQRLRTIPGAHLILVDPGLDQDQAATWPPSPHLGVYRVYPAAGTGRAWSVVSAN